MRRRSDETTQRLLMTLLIAGMMVCCLFGVGVLGEVDEEEGNGGGGSKGGHAPKHVDLSKPYLLGYIHNDNGHCDKEPTGLMIQPSKCIENHKGGVFYATCNSTHWVRGTCEKPKHKCPKAGGSPVGLCEKGEVIERFSEKHCDFGLQTMCSKKLPVFDDKSFVVTEAFFNPGCTGEVATQEVNFLKFGECIKDLKGRSSIVFCVDGEVSVKDCEDAACKKCGKKTKIPPTCQATNQVLQGGVMVRCVDNSSKKNDKSGGKNNNKKGGN